MYDAAAKLTSYKQTDHDMTSFVAQIQSAVEELNMLLDADSVEEMQRKHDMVLALHVMSPDFDRIHDQILTVQEVPSMDSPMTRLLCVPIPRLETRLSILNLQQWCLLEEEGIVEDVVVETQIHTYNAHIARSRATPKTNATT